MNLQQIKYFLAVVDYGTFLAAASQVHVSQPTLSASIKKLEESLGVILFYRGSRSITLTSDGELFHKKARKAYNELEAVKLTLLGSHQTINIGIVNSIPMDHVANIIKVYKSRNPTVFIEITIGDSESLNKLLITQKIDLLFSSKSKINADFNLLFEEPLKLVVSIDSPLAKFDNIAISQLREHKFIERIHCESWDSVHGLLDKHNVALQSVCRAEDDETILSLVSIDLGISIMPMRRTPYNVKFIQINELNILRPIGVYSLPDKNNCELNSLLNVAVQIQG